MTWVSTPRQGMVANNKHHFRHSRDQVHKASRSSSDARTRSHSRSKSRSGTTTTSKGSTEGGGGSRRPDRTSSSSGPQKRRRSRSPDHSRNGFSSRTDLNHHHSSHHTKSSRTSPPVASSSSSSLHKDDRHHSGERSTHYRNSDESNNKTVGDKGRESSVLSPRKRRKSSSTTEVAPRNRDNSTSSKRDHHRSSRPPPHRQHNKPSAHRDSPRDHASRRSTPSTSHHHRPPPPRRESSTTPLKSSPPVASSSKQKDLLDELNESRGRNSATKPPPRVSGGGRLDHHRQTGSVSPQKKRRIRSGDASGPIRISGISNHHHATTIKKKVGLSCGKARVFKNERYFNKPGGTTGGGGVGERPFRKGHPGDEKRRKIMAGDKAKKGRDSSVLFPGKPKLNTGGNSSRNRDKMSDKQQHHHHRGSGHNSQHPSALENNRDTNKKHDSRRSGRSLSQSRHQEQQQPRRDSSSSTSSLSTTVAPPPPPTAKILFDELNGNNSGDEYEDLTQVEKWVRSAPDELYYSREVDGHATATERTQTLCDKFEATLLAKSKVAREEAEDLGDSKMKELIQIENVQFAEQKQLLKLKKQGKGKCCHHNKKPSDNPTSAVVATCTSSDKETDPKNCGTSSGACSGTESPCSSSSTKKCRHSSGDSDNNDEDDSDSSSASSDSSSEDEDGFSMTRSDTANRELERRKKHPRRLHDELWHNDPGLMNDGPVCRCSAKARRFGIRHGFYPGEERIPPCDHFTNNKKRLFHYRITISPPKNFLISTPTVINHDGHEYIFEGFSIFSHYRLDLTLPPCKVIRFNIKYDVFVEEEKFPESFCVKELLLFETYLFREILELVDLRYDWNDETGCSQFHLMPRFVRQLPDNGQEVLSMSRVLIHLLKGDRDLVKEEDLHKLYTVEQSEWQNFADRHKGTIVTKWGMKPCALRVDQIDRDITGQEEGQEDGIPFPLIVHFGIRPPQLSYAGNAGYQRAWRRYVKYRHLLSNMPKPSPQDKLKLLQKEMKLQAMRTASNMKRDVTVAISAKGFRTTGICCDLVQHAMLIPVLVAHLRFHKCLETLEKCMVYPFQNRFLLQLAMTHPSYRENFGTNPDHARNALTNCGIRQPEYGDRRIHYASTRKRGINTLINIMAKFGADQETESDITHNERLEFLGDAVVEFTTSIHLFHIFPDLEEGGLATYRAAIVQNQHLAVLAQALNLDQYMLYAHGSDLCHDSELRHAMANCFEALMGALFLDGGIHAADRVFGSTLFGTQPLLLDMWANYPKHPLQQEEPSGDRHWVESHEVLQKLATFETSIGVNFNHIRLLARAFTDRSLGYNNLTKGSNQRLEFLGDTVLQLISSEYLYRHFPDHHEGHLSLLRSSLVNNRTQSLVCEDLGMPQYAMRGDPKSEMKTKDKADLLEAFLGALYIDKGLKYCILFCQVCFFPRLSNSITKQEWNDSKSKLQQCCLTLRAMDGREPDIPVYKVTESLGPTNTRTYIVAVYFRGKRLATAQGHSIQEAEMNAAAEALEVSGHLFPQLHHQRRIMDKTKKVH